MVGLLHYTDSLFKRSQCGRKRVLCSRSSERDMMADGATAELMRRLGHLGNQPDSLVNQIPQGK